MRQKTEMLLQKLRQEFGLVDEIQGDGFFYKARHREFDTAGADRALNILKEISSEFSRDEYIEIVKDIYNIPEMLSGWRKECLINGADDKIYNKYLNEFRVLIRYIVEMKYG